MYQNSLGMITSVLNTDPSPVYQNATGVPKVTTVTNVPKGPRMILAVCACIRFCAFPHGHLKNPLLVS